MTDKEFRRLSRADLIEIIYELQQSEKMLQKENEDLKLKLEDRRVTVSEAGSLAEVLARLNGLFEAAQATADGYRDEAEQLLEEARRTREQADNYLADIKQRAANLASLTIQQRKDMHARTEAGGRCTGEPMASATGRGKLGSGCCSSFCKGGTVR